MTTRYSIQAIICTALPHSQLISIQREWMHSYRWRSDVQELPMLNTSYRRAAVTGLLELFCVYKTILLNYKIISLAPT